MTEPPSDGDALALPADADAIRDEQVARALRRLDARGGLTPRQRATIERLADRLLVALHALFAPDANPIDSADTVDGDPDRPLCSD